MFQVYDPVGVAATASAKNRRNLETLNNKNIGFVWNQYVSTKRFWPEFEKSVEALYQVSEVQRIYKENTWSPAPREKLLKLLEDVDCLIAGVGA